MNHTRIHCVRVAALILGAVLGLTASTSLAADSAPAPNAQIQSALESPGRFAGDSEEDGRRKPQDVLEFMGVRPGMQVLDYFAGAGYYSELLARIVGPSGSVIVYNSPFHAKRAGEKLAARFGDNRLANVKQVTATPNELQLRANTLDIALFVLAYHDLYNKPKDAATPAANIEQITASVFEAVKPGGVVVVIDHAANAGGDTREVASALHRIGPKVVQDDFTKAGFMFEGESMVLRKSTDDHSKPVHDPSVRHKTDQFIYRFRKAE